MNTFLIILFLIFVLWIIFAKKIKHTQNQKEKEHFFKFPNTEKETFKPNEKVNVWCKPESNEIRFYNKYPTNPSKSLIGVTHKTKLYNEINNKENHIAIIYKSFEDTIFIKLTIKKINQ